MGIKDDLRHAGARRVTLNHFVGEKPDQWTCYIAAYREDAGDAGAGIEGAGETIEDAVNDALSKLPDRRRELTAEITSRAFAKLR